MLASLIEAKRRHVSCIFSYKDGREEKCTILWMGMEERKRKQQLQ
jgi:hypothetical protein